MALKVTDTPGCLQRRQSRVRAEGSGRPPAGSIFQFPLGKQYFWNRAQNAEEGPGLGVTRTKLASPRPWQVLKKISEVRPCVPPLTDDQAGGTGCLWD